VVPRPLSAPTELATGLSPTALIRVRKESGWGVPCSAPGSPQGAFGLTPPGPSCRLHAARTTPPPPAIAGSQATRLVSTAWSWRRSAAATAARAWASLKGFRPLLIRRW
jgi:hypothetical protein